MSLIPLAGERGLVAGIANGQSMACGYAKAFRGLGAALSAPPRPAEGQRHA